MSRDYYLKHREELKAAAREYRRLQKEMDPEGVRQKNRERYLAKRERVLVQTAEYRKANREVLKENSKKYRKNKPYCHRNSMLRRLYGISEEQYNQMLSKQNGVCKICMAERADNNREYLFVDHCHSTGKIRGLLCANCNSGLGYFRDRIDLLAAAMEYLSK